MREAALAKSYRPNSVLLTPDRFPCVGAGAIGELFFFLPQIYIGELKARIRHADPHVPQVISRTGRAYRATKRLRSEVGAILSIEIVPPGGKRLFPAVAGVQAFSDPHAFPGYLIELFEVPPLQTIANDRWGRRELFNSLFRLLLSLGNGARSYLLPAMGRTPILELQLTTAIRNRRAQGKSARFYHARHRRAYRFAEGAQGQALRAVFLPARRYAWLHQRGMRLPGRPARFLQARRYRHRCFQGQHEGA